MRAAGGRAECLEERVNHAGDATPPPVVRAPEPPASPLFSIWTRPRPTLRSILATDPRRGSLVLPVASGLAQGILAGAAIASQPDMLPGAALLPFSVLVAAGAILGPLVTLAFVQLNAAMIVMTGRWLGGHGRFVEVRAALAWSLVPSLWGLLLWAPRLALLGAEAFLPNPLEVHDDAPTVALVAIFTLADVVIGVWTFVVAARTVGEAHGFSGWRGFFAIVLAVALYVAFGAILAGILLGLGVALALR